MTLPHFLRAIPVTTLTTLDDDDTVAYRALLGRWLIDLALLLGWVRTGRRRPPLSSPSLLGQRRIHGPDRPGRRR